MSAEPQVVPRGRDRLGPRRHANAGEIESGGVRYRWQASRLASGQWGEVFIDAEKPGSAAAIAATDAAIAASLAMQCGCDVATLSHAMTKLANGRAAGPLGAVLEILESEA